MSIGSRVDGSMHNSCRSALLHDLDNILVGRFPAYRLARKMRRVVASKSTSANSQPGGSLEFRLLGSRFSSIYFL
jgi:hypothetical protein